VGEKLGKNRNEKKKKEKKKNKKDQTRGLTGSSKPHGPLWRLRVTGCQKEEVACDRGLIIFSFRFIFHWTPCHDLSSFFCLLLSSFLQRV